MTLMMKRFGFYKIFQLVPVLVLLSTLAWADSRGVPFVVPKDSTALPETALIETSKGSFEVRFYREEAPITVSNFVHLAKKNFYRNVSFHRLIPGYVIQGGDPTGVGKSGGPGYTVPPEFSNIRHVKGTIGMARLPGAKNPERRSNGSQFYISLTSAPQLDGLYTVFAQVIRGMEIVEKLEVGDSIERVRLPKGSVR